ncbi:MAG: hypothetical protein HYU37_19690 [Acidobacteria bacterium]|nr:hypothetical protein [Acidobacteriota bacterium]
MWLFLGVGLGIAYVVLSRPIVDDGPPAWLAGAAAGIVGFLGLGHLAYSFVARREKPPADRTDMAM